MNMKPISVVVPTHDGRATLRRALDSLQANAHHIEEVLLVFSNSSAEYREWCARLLPLYSGHLQVRCLDSGSDSNSAKARNLGIAAVHAPYVAFLDDDDEWMSHKLDAYLRTIAQRQLAGDFVLFSTVVSCRDDRSDWLLFPSIRYAGQAIADFVLSPLGGVQTSAILLPSALARRAGFDPSLIRHTDYDFCIRLGEAGARFVWIEQPLSYWYRRGSLVAKGATFDYCAHWLHNNRHRISRDAFISYLEKDLFATARVSGRWRDYLRFQRENLDGGERLASLARLGARALRKLAHPATAGHRGKYQPA